jgi:hypothetical protein
MLLLGLGPLPFPLRQESLRVLTQPQVKPLWLMRVLLQYPLPLPLKFHA